MFQSNWLDPLGSFKQFDYYFKRFEDKLKKFKVQAMVFTIYMVLDMWVWLCRSFPNPYR
jgi:hypothetical protein